MTDTDRMNCNGDSAVTPVERSLVARCDELRGQRNYYRRELKKARVYLVVMCVWLFLGAVAYAAPFNRGWLSGLELPQPEASLIGLGAVAVVVVLTTVLVVLPPRKEWE